VGSASRGTGPGGRPCVPACVSFGPPGEPINPVPPMTVSFMAPLSNTLLIEDSVRAVRHEGAGERVLAAAALVGASFLSFGCAPAVRCSAWANAHRFLEQRLAHSLRAVA